MLICFGGVVVNNSHHRSSKVLRLMLFISFTAVAIRYCSRGWTRFCRCYHVLPILIAVAQFHSPTFEAYLLRREWNVAANRFLNKVSECSRQCARAGVLRATLFWLRFSKFSFFRLPGAQQAEEVFSIVKHIPFSSNDPTYKTISDRLLSFNPGIDLGVGMGVKIAETDTIKFRFESTCGNGNCSDNKHMFTLDLDLDKRVDKFSK